MDSFLITYDLTRPHHLYPQLWEAISAFGSTCHCLDSVWVVKSDKTVSEIADLLSRHVEEMDAVFVAKLTKEEVAGIRLHEQCSRWLEDHL